jgi:hypothetical protein
VSDLKPKKTKSKAPQKPKNRYRISHQITISPEATKLLEKWIAVHGPGTKSMLVDMAIRRAERDGIFSGDIPDARKSSTMEEAIVEHLPILMARLLAQKPQAGG